MTQSLVGARALVTGASSGIGAEIARALAEKGVHLVLAARRQQRLDDLAEELGNAHGVMVDRIRVDLAAEGGAAALIAAVEELGVEIDVLVNNAGVGIHGPGLDHGWEAEQDMLRLNVFAVAQLTKHFGRAMRVRARGHILQVASTAAFQPCPTYAAYGASKAFVLHHAEALGEELRDSGVVVTVLCPGSTNTEFFQVSGNERGALQESTSLDPDEVARVAVDAMLRGRRSVVTGLSNRLSVLGLRLIPRRLQATLARRVLE